MIACFDHKSNKLCQKKKNGFDFDFKWVIKWHKEGKPHTLAIRLKKINKNNKIGVDEKKNRLDLQMTLANHIVIYFIHNSVKYSIRIVVEYSKCTLINCYLLAHKLLASPNATM